MIRNARGLDLRRYLEKLYFGMHDMQYRMGKPTIAALTGPARAAGVTLAVSCDVIVASDTASIGYPEIEVGVIPAMHFVHLPRQIGRHKAFELLFSGKPISADEAYSRGLVNYVVPQAEVKERARALAKDFAMKSPLVMELARNSSCGRTILSTAARSRMWSRRSATSSSSMMPRKVSTHSTRSVVRDGEGFARPTS